MQPDGRLAALLRFQEAARDIERDRVLRPLTRRARKAAADHFANQGRDFVRLLGQIRYLFEGGRLQEALSAADWLALWAVVVTSNRADMEARMGALLLEALTTGGAGLLAGLDPEGELGIAFGLRNPRAVEYARQRAAQLVTQIDQTTRDRLNDLIGRAVENGWSYQRTAEAITTLFDGFGEARALRIAVYEMRDAFEAGNRLAAQQMQAQGLTIEKAWLTAGDNRVRAAHRANAAQGYIPLDENFSSGHDRPPTDPGCRCSGVYRRVKRNKS